MEETKEICQKVNSEMIDDIDEYVDLWPDRSCLDGWFSAEQLRRIADAIDECGRRVAAAKVPPNN